MQLSTQSKMFCSCRVVSSFVEPNTLVCPTCLGLPGALPVLNRTAVEGAMMIGMALGCQVATKTKFDRKNYTYPDLVKGYQISQYDQPICYDGKLALNPNSDGTGANGRRVRFDVRIERVHMEEDVARLVHIDGNGSEQGYSLMDFNRSGTPLMEIVTRPDLRYAEDVIAYIETLQAIIRFLGVGDANMEEGSFRCDANVSVRPKGSEILNPKVELKNMNRIAAVARAVNSEIERQIAIYEAGGRVAQETRGWDDVSGKTVLQRSKEEANDYRYFYEPDLPTLTVAPEWVQKIKEQLPDLPDQYKARLMRGYGLSEYDAAIIVANRKTADFFEATLAELRAAEHSAEERFAMAKNLANLLNTEMARILGEQRLTHVYETKASPTEVATLAELFRARKVTNSTAKQVLEILATQGGKAADIISSANLSKVTDAAELESIVEAAIEQNPRAVQDYLKGKETAIKFLVGQVMRATRGNADATASTGIVKKCLESLRNSVQN